MSQLVGDSGKGDQHQNDHRLIQAYREATSLDKGGLEALCPSYVELSGISTRYENETLIGKGGVKEVFRTFDNRTRRWVAMARPREDRGPEFYDLFVNEAWLTSTLEHPNIINVHDVGVDSAERPFFTMDLKGNTTLADLIRSSTRDRGALLRDYLRICDAMAYAHSREIIHLDLKPDNIQTDHFGEVMVCDWGLGKIVSQDDEDQYVEASTEVLDNMTLVGELKGTLGYMAPEQVEGGDKDHRTDIFSLGCILHAILTGDPPFVGDRHSVMEATSLGLVTDPCKKYPDLEIPPSLAAVAMKALAKRPDDRYQSVSELRDEIRRYLEGFSTNAEDTSFLREARLFVSRNRTPVLISFLSMVLLTVLATLFLERVDFLQQSVLAESRLADQYATEAEVATERYVDSLSESKEQQRALSKSLLSSVGALKNRGIFDTPMKSIREALVLADHALALDPQSKAARYQIFALNLIQLNFKEALNYPLPENHGRYEYMSFAEAFPEYDFHRTKRPSAGTLRGFLEKARELETNQSPVIERMISYDTAIRSSMESYDKVILEFLKYLNPDKTGIELEFSPQESAMTLRMKEGIRLVANRGGSGECVLRYLNPRSLAVVTEEDFELNELSKLAIQKLDLTGCSGLTLEDPLSLPLLETIIIDSQIHSRRELRKWIQSSLDFEIIESP
ncbi:serine/threonine protein kinase [Haloferula sp.]|uniref:serine/threonine protein kinase n=1 Tax=Haloferula sp. TaxID=2497595 RepID=UPI00329A9BF8